MSLCIFDMELNVFLKNPMVDGLIYEIDNYVFRLLLKMPKLYLLLMEIYNRWWISVINECSFLFHDIILCLCLVDFEFVF